VYARCNIAKKSLKKSRGMQGGGGRVRRREQCTTTHSSRRTGCTMDKRRRNKGILTTRGGHPEFEHVQLSLGLDNGTEKGQDLTARALAKWARSVRDAPL